MIRKGNWKLVHYEGFAPQLFDLKADPDEIKTLATLRKKCPRTSVRRAKGYLQSSRGRQARQIRSTGSCRSPRRGCCRG